jgi:hypothetical protein
MNKNFIKFLEEKDPKFINVNEGISDLIRYMVGDINLQAEEQKLIVKINAAFKKFTNGMIGEKYYNKHAKKSFFFRKEQTDSIYRNFKINLKAVITRSYKGEADANRRGVIDFEKEKQIFEIEREILDEKEKEDVVHAYAYEYQQKYGRNRARPESPRTQAPPSEKPLLSAPSATPIATPPPDEEVAASNTAPSTPLEPSIPILGGITNFKFMQNLNKLILNIEQHFRDNGENVPNKPIFNAFKLIQRLYKHTEMENDQKRRFKKHKKNINYLGNDNWNLLLAKIIEAFVSNQCDFAVDTFTNDAIKDFKRVADIYNPVETNYSAFDRGLRKSGENWRIIALSLSQINKSVDEFCSNNPELCDKKGKGSGKLLSKLQENKNITFSEWLLITENKLF